MLLTGRPAQVSITVLCFVLGLLVVMQLRTQGRIAKAAQAQSNLDQSRVISDLIDANAKLDRQVDDLDMQLNKYRYAPDESNLDTLVADLNRLKIINGLVEVSGPGIAIRVDGEMTATDMQDLVNELRNAGAEAIALNDQRLIVNSVIAADRGGLSANGVRVTSPYVFQAIGQPDVLERAIERKGGLVPILRYNYPSVSITLTKHERDKLTLPMFQGTHEFRYARAQQK